MAAKYNYSQDSAVAFADFGVKLTQAMQAITQANGADQATHDATTEIYKALDELLATVRRDIMNDVRSIYGG